VGDPRDWLVAVGSNIDPARNVERALALLERRGRVRRVSSFYRSAPERHAERPRYVNGALAFDAGAKSAEAVRETLRAVERRLGRVRTADRDASRVIDLDLVGVRPRGGAGELLETEDVGRPFVAVPLVEIAPAVRFPGGGERLGDSPAAEEARHLLPLGSLTRRLNWVIDSGGASSGARRQ
jgi:2-amino-4-hydroxy-6-hydroxymethyldihydropteridine diphosphokinase